MKKSIAIIVISVLSLTAGTYITNSSYYEREIEQLRVEVVVKGEIIHRLTDSISMLNNRLEIK